MRYICFGIAMLTMSLIGTSSLESSLEPLIESGDVAPSELVIISIVSFGGIIICFGMVAYGALLHLSAQQVPISQWADKMVHIGKWTYIEKITACLLYATACTFIAWAISSNIMECTFCIKRTFYSDVIPDTRMVIYTWSYLMVLASLAFSLPAGLMWIFADKIDGGKEKADG